MGLRIACCPLRFNHGIHVPILHLANPWLLDSGATHHMTSDLANLSLHQPYQGEDAVLIGDGLLFLSLILVHYLYPLPLKIYYYPMFYVYPIFTRILSLSIRYVILTRSLLNSFLLTFR